MKSIKKLLTKFYLLLSRPWDLDLEKFEQLESKKVRGKEWL